MPEPEQGIEPGDNAMSLNPGSRGVLGRIVLVCGAITAGAGALILVGWAIGSDALTAMGTGYIPAPNTALLFVLLGSAVLVREARPASRVIHRIATAAAVFSAVMGSVTLIGFVIGLNIDDWLFSTARMLGEVPMGHMSPVAAFSFVLAGGSLLLLECQARTWAAISGTLIMLAGAVCLMGYWFGAPRLYGGTVIPVALPTSLALVALGVGLTAAAGPDTWPLNILIGPSTRARLLRALLPTVVLLALIKDWITAVLLEHSDPGVVLASAMTAVSFLLAVGFVVSWVSRAIGDAIDRTEAERQRAELALARRTNLYDMLSQTNKAIMRIAGRDELFDAVCRIAVEHGHFHSVWIGVIDTVHQRLKPIAHYGDDTGYLDQLDISGGSAGASRRGLTGRTLLSGTHVIRNDFLNDPATASWHEAARRAGIRAAGKFPIRQGGAVVGAISFYADEPRFFSKDLIGTLDVMAEDVSFALDNFARQAEISYAAEALRMSEAKFRLLAEEDLAGVVIIQDGRFKYVNPAMARMFGYSPEDLLRASSVSVLEFVAEEDRALVEENLRRRQDGEARSMGYTFRGRKKDGSLAYLEVFGSRIPFEGRFAVMATVLDITERKRAEEAQARLAAIVESSNDAIIGRALDGTVTSWNAAAERILGYTAAETIGRDPVEMFPPLLQQQIAEYRKLVRAGQRVPNHDTVHIAKDGRHIDFAANLSAIKDNSGRIIGTATTLRDITERKQNEQTLHDNAKRLRNLSRRLIAVEETERRKINRELHDRVGASLSALNLNLSIVRSQLPQESLRAVGTRLNDTQKLLEETTTQVRDLMADLHPPALDDYGLHAALRTYVESLGARIAVPISIRGEPFVPRLPLEAETALFRVAQGALVNAVTHAQAKRIQVLLAAFPDRMTLTITDDGVGFYVAHASLTHASWGLAIMRERAEAVGAELTVESAPGEGTRVCVEIPRKKR